MLRFYLRDGVPSLAPTERHAGGVGMHMLVYWKAGNRKLADNETSERKSAHL